jgi:transcriptional regulator with XRE-family HTH domain
MNTAIADTERASEPARLRDIVASNLRLRRKELGMRQDDVKDALAAAGISIATITYGGYERSARGLNIDMLGALAVALRTSPAALVAPRAES